MLNQVGKTWEAWLPRLLQRLRLREHQIYLVLTLLIGLAAGLAAVLFTLCIENLNAWLFGLSPSVARLLVVPVLGSLAAGVLLAFYFPESRGSGIPQVKADFHLSEGVIPARVPLGKFITGVLCIGAGHSLGREGPSVQIGGGLASALGRWLRLSPGRVKDLVPVGTAAALSAAFNTPIAAVLFALEEIVADMNAAVLGSTVLASVAAVVLERSILGNEPLFHVPAYEMLHPAELLGYAALGLVGGLASVLFCKVLLWARGFFRALPAWTEVWQPAFGGLLIGVILIFVPQVMGVGYGHVDAALNGRLVLQTLILLGCIKGVATIFSYASGNAGGIFAPTLFIGAMVGGATGLIMQASAPFPTAAPGAYALVGMGAVFAGIIRAPMTSVFMIFELTQDYQIIVPLMVANLVSYSISRRYQRVPVYQALLMQDGIHLPTPEERVAPGRWRVGDMMNREPRTLPVEATVGSAWEIAHDSGQPCFPVLDGECLLGLVSRERLEQLNSQGNHDRPLRDFLDPYQQIHVHADQPIQLALERLGQTPGVLPVVNRKDIRRLEGIISLEEILRALHYTRRF